MSHYSDRPEPLGLSNGGASSEKLDADATGWTLLEAGDHDDLVLTRFLPHLPNAMAIARNALRRANLRGPQRVPVAIGLHRRDSLLLSVRLARGAATVSVVDSARAELLRFAAACCRP